MRRLGQLSPAVADWLLAAGVLTLFAVEALFSDAVEDRGAMIALAATMALPLGLRRRWPLTVVAVSFGAGIAAAVLLAGFHDVSTPFLVLLIGAYTAGTIPRLAAALAGLALAWLLVAVVALTADERIAGDVLFPAGFALFAWAVGRVIRERTVLAAELHEAALQADEAHAQDAARAVAEERRRIAREMHDLVGHSVSVMVVQAGGARRILDRDPGRAVEAAARIEQTGRTALAEMRRLLGLMGPDEPAGLAPQPTLAGLTALVARLRSAGLPVTVSEEGEPRDLPAGAEAAAYRIVQEALTNALKHAGPTHTRVQLRWADDALELSIADEGPARTPDGEDGPRLAGSGHGLVGMRERTRLYGGVFSAGPRGGGGFEVRASIPYEQSAVSAA